MAKLLKKKPKSLHLIGATSDVHGFVPAEFSFLFLKVKRDKDVQGSLLMWNSISVSTPTGLHALNHYILIKVYQQHIPSEEKAFSSTWNIWHLGTKGFTCIVLIPVADSVLFLGYIFLLTSWVYVSRPVLSITFWVFTHLLYRMVSGI